MIVNYIVSDKPYFSFDPCIVPPKHFIVYTYETDIFAYLNSHLLPTDIELVRIETDGVKSCIVIDYDLDDSLVNGMPPFDPLPDDQMPF